jgi:hypothetical protein
MQKQTRTSGGPERLQSLPLGRRITEADLWSLAILAIIITLIFAPLVQHWVRLTGDYAFHGVFAEQMRKSGLPSLPHFAYHAVLAIVQAIIELFIPASASYTLEELSQTIRDPAGNIGALVELGQRYGLASIITCMLFIGLLALVVWGTIVRALALPAWGPGPAGRILALLLTLGLLLAAPVSALRTWDHSMYLGYIGLNVLHSPTMIVLKPLALLSFFYAVALFGERPAPGEVRDEAPRTRLRSTLFIGAGAVVTILSTIAKPNYTLCLLPGLALFVPWAWYRRMTIRWLPLILGLVLPAVVVLAWQYYFTYQTAGIRQNSIEFRPLLAMRILSPNYLLYKFFLSILFPGLVWLLFLRAVWADRRMVLAWLVFSCGALWAYLAAESTGPGDGNFTWGVQMASLGLFLESIRFLLQRQVPGIRPAEPAGPPRPWWPVLICAAAFALHVGYGILYNIRVMNIGSEKPGWW